MPKGRNILKLDVFLEKNRDEETPPTRVKPIDAKDIILTHYTCIIDFSFEDVKQMNHRINTLEKNSFSPTTTAAGVVYLYAKTAKSKKQTLKQVSTLFNVSTMSIQRFINKYKLCF